MATSLVEIPEQGQLVQVRNRHFIVGDVWAGDVRGEDRPMHRVQLECVDDDRLGETLDVLWEHEVHRRVLSDLGLPRPERWDPLERLEAFLLASRWSLSSVMAGLPLQAPFRGAIQIEEYQLEPVVRALGMPRVNLLIADDVGLGKTVEAGMVMQELLARHRARRVLILCPASLQRQWAEEMRQKFSLSFEIVDRAYVHRIRREYGVHVNPWASYPRLITSMDFLKRETPLNQFRNSLRRGGDGSAAAGRAVGLRDWDLLIADESHNLAPAGRGQYVRDSDRTHMIREILPHFEHRLFLTATPHNGYTESFTAMLEMLDPLRFARGTTVNQDQLKAIMVRRIKDQMVDALGNRRFPKREVLSLDVGLTDREAALFDTLDRYASLRLARAGFRDKLPIRFTITLLKKRLLSSVAAFHESIQVHHAHLVGEEALDEDRSRVVEQLARKVAEDYSDDGEKDQVEEVAITESSCFFQPTDEERRLVEEMKNSVAGLVEAADSKVERLLRWIEEHLLEGGDWNRDRLLLFTEYKHTLEYIERELLRRGWGDRIIKLFGGLGSKERERVKAVFATEPDEHPVRILLATDAASEGLNLQAHCRYLIHFEIPWNPNKMEQRNGRIDRHGQRAREVFCWHFAYQGRQDQDFLDVVVDKVRTQRQDLGSVGDVIAAQVEEAIRGERRAIVDPTERRDRCRDEVKAELVTKERIRELRYKITEARERWHLTGDTLRLVLEQGLRLVGHPGLERLDTGDLAGKAWLLRALPASWSECAPWIKDERGRLMPLVFDDRLARDRKGVTLVHLDHPLVKRAVGVFRANLWSIGLHESHQLQRASYRVVDDPRVQEPVVVLVSRLVAVSATGQKLHEEFLLTGGDIQKHDLLLTAPDKLSTMLDIEGTHPSIPAQVGAALRAYFAGHEPALRKAQQAQAAGREKEIRAELRQLGLEEARQVRELIDERIKEIDRRVKQMARNLENPQEFLPGFEPENLDQYRQDTQWLRRRRDQLVEERATEPDRVKARYELRGAPRCFPLALLYLIPSSYVQEVS
ncbi:MAG: DISARM system SNF2-like helicase DrmD [Pseudomonadota bacterium]